MQVEIGRNAGVTTVTLNRPEKLNALIPEMREELVRLFTLLGQEASTKAAGLTSATPRSCRLQPRLR
jgi:enoyl-CoA hydratase/carnithine racemase